MFAAVFSFSILFRHSRCHRRLLWPPSFSCRESRICLFLQRVENMPCLEMTAKRQELGEPSRRVCYQMPVPRAGLLALGHHHGVNTAADGEPDDLEVAEDVMRTCYEMYRRTPTGLAPELAFFKSSETSGAAPTVENDKPGGGDFVIKQAVSACSTRPTSITTRWLCPAENPPSNPSP